MDRFTLQSPTGAALSVGYHRATAAVPRARAIVLIFHGLAEHSARYAFLANHLAERGYDVFAHDHRGHGQTHAADAPSRRFARTAGAEAVLADCHAVQRHAQTIRPGIPVVVLGHSMGGLIALNYAERYADEIAGVAVWNADFRVGIAERVGRLVLHFEKALKGSDVASTLLQRATFEAWAKSVSPRRTAFDWLSHDPASVDAYIADPLCGFSPTISMMEDILSLIFAGGSTEALRRLPPRLPVHLLGGTEDPVTDGGAAIRWLAARLNDTGHDDVSVGIVEGARHETLHEIAPLRDEAIDALDRWLDRLTDG